MKRFGVILMGIGLLCGTARAAAPLRFTSLEWPPYVGAELYHDGLVGQRFHQALALLGLQARIDYYPWRRALRLVQANSVYVGYLPQYASANPDNAYCSVPLMQTPLGLAQRRDDPLLRWQTLFQLRPYRIGVVAGYSNTQEFDALVDARELQVDVTNSDRSNLLKLAAGRTDLAVVDPVVFHYLLSRDPELSALAGYLTMSPQLLGNKQLLVCFRQTEEGLRLRDQLNIAIARLGPAPVVTHPIPSLSFPTEQTKKSPPDGGQ